MLLMIARKKGRKKDEGQKKTKKTLRRVEGSGKKNRGTIEWKKVRENRGMIKRREMEVKVSGENNAGMKNGEKQGCAERMEGEKKSEGK